MWQGVVHSLNPTQHSLTHRAESMAHATMTGCVACHGYISVPFIQEMERGVCVRWPGHVQALARPSHPPAAVEPSLPLLGTQDMGLMSRRWMAERTIGEGRCAAKRRSTAFSSPHPPLNSSSFSAPARESSRSSKCCTMPSCPSGCRQATKVELVGFGGTTLPIRRVSGSKPKFTVAHMSKEQTAGKRGVCCAVCRPRAGCMDVWDEGRLCGSMQGIP